MSSPARRAAPALAALMAAYIGCVQDFDQFQPTGAASSSAGPGASSSAHGGAGGDASSSSGPASGSGGSGGSTIEDCLDGIDNNGDGAADCADPACNPDFECVAPAPAGWEGYFRINTTPFPNMAPAMCPDGAPPATYFDGPGEAACAPCACGDWAGAECETPPLMCWTNSSECMGSDFIDLTGLQTNGMCFAPPDIENQVPRSCALTAELLTTMGACPPSGGEPMNSAPWANQDDVCGQVIKGGAGCGNGQVCVPKGGGDYNGPVCIRKMGQDACPAGFQAQIDAAMDGVDDRACSACQCDVSGATCMGGGYTVNNADNCTMQDTPVLSTACVDVSGELDNGTGSMRSNAAPQPTGGTCAPNGGTPSGGVTPQGSVTFCCL